MPETLWDPQHIGDLTGRTYLVTGANGGIGYYASAQLLEAGASVILAGRNPAKLDAAAAALVTSGAAPDRVQRVAIDTSSIASARAAASGLDNSIALDGILLNAGLVKGPASRTLTSEGHELLFATNIAGHFAFVGSALPRLGGEAPRIVWMGSSTAIKGDYDFTDPESASNYAPMRAYAGSKAAATMVGVEAQQRLAAVGSPVLSVIAHPGFSVGGRSPRVPGVNEPTLRERVTATLVAGMSQTKEQGAHAPVRALTDAAVHGGEFVGPDGYKGPTRRGAAPGYTTDRAAGARLWTYLESATGVSWP
ncbi:MAG: SDR family NAD(P)-dependent oxidoreductase [Propionibacteriaceae bacterium]|nr:SDR family NAD(P)-dependent oxidoreductase [Propionibacteriaceae bacterium]